MCFVQKRYNNICKFNFTKSKVEYIIAGSDMEVPR